MRTLLNFILIIFIFIGISTCGILDSPDSKPIFHTIYEINVVKIDGTNHKIIGTGSNIKILYSKNRIAFRGSNDLYSINFDGSDLTPLIGFETGKQLLMDYALSSDGEKILLTVYEHQSYNIYVMNSDGTGYYRLTNLPGSADLDPNFSFDMQEIVFRRDWNICKINVSGSDFMELQIHPDSSVYRKPYFVLDNNRILYFEEIIKYWSDSRSLHLYNLDTKIDSILIISKNPTLYGPYLDVAPDGKILFFERNVSGGDSLKIIDLINNSITSISEGYVGSFSSDGKEIIYSDLKNIYLIDSDGNNKRTIYEELDEKKSVSKPKLSLDKQTAVFESSYSATPN